jgi:hypothetical protein
MFQQTEKKFTPPSLSLLINSVIEEKNLSLMLVANARPSKIRRTMMHTFLTLLCFLKAMEKH